MVHRFEHTEEQQANPHARGKKHGEPRQIGVFRHGLLPAEPDLRNRHEDQRDAEQNEDVHDDHEQPIQLGRGEIANGEEDHPGLIREEHGQQHKGHRRQARDHEDRVMNVKTQRAEGSVDIVLADLEISLNLIRIGWRSGTGRAGCGVGHGVSDLDALSEPRSAGSMARTTIVGRSISAPV